MVIWAIKGMKLSLFQQTSHQLIIKFINLSKSKLPWSIKKIIAHATSSKAQPTDVDKNFSMILRYKHNCLWSYWCTVHERVWNVVWMQQLSQFSNKRIQENVLSGKKLDHLCNSFISICNKYQQPSMPVINRCTFNTKHLLRNKI
jgi:NAD-dependent oxidoreductase involved in siderophore biosynthesis